MKTTNKRVLLCLLAGLLALLLAACGGQPDKDSAAVGEGLTLYLFSGESAEFALTDGVVVLGGGEMMLYGGELTAKVPLEIAKYSITYCVPAGEAEMVLFESSGEDTTGGLLDIGGEHGSVGGTFTPDADFIACLTQGFYLNIEITAADGTAASYQVPLQVRQV